MYAAFVAMQFMLTLTAGLVLQRNTILPQINLYR